MWCEDEGSLKHVSIKLYHHQLGMIHLPGHDHEDMDGKP